MHKISNLQSTLKSLLFLSFFLIPTILAASPSIGPIWPTWAIILIFALLFTIPLIFILGLVFPMVYMGRIGKTTDKKVKGARSASFLFGSLNAFGGMLWGFWFFSDWFSYGSYGFNGYLFLGAVVSFIPLILTIMGTRKEKEAKSKVN